MLENILYLVGAAVWMGLVIFNARSLLLFSSENGHHRLMALSIKCGGHREGHWGKICRDICIDRNDPVGLKLLLDAGVDPAYPGDTPLIRAVEVDGVDVLRLLLYRHPKPERLSYVDLLLTAADTRAGVSTVDIILNHGGMKHEKLRDSLYLAVVLSKSPSSIQYLLDLGADPVDMARNYPDWVRSADSEISDLLTSKIGGSGTFLREA